MWLMVRICVVTLIVGGIVAAVDFQSQAKAHGRDIQDFAVASYAETLKIRATEWVDGERVGERPLVSFLPEPTGTWVRTKWSREADAALKGQHSLTQLHADTLDDIADDNGFIGSVIKAQFDLAQSRKAKQRRVYLRDDEIIILSIRRSLSQQMNAGQTALAASATGAIASMTDRETFARLRGVTFVESRDPFGKDRGYRTITGALPEGIKISVRARAKHGSIKSLLSRIDYDGIVAQLDVKVAGVGNGVLNSLPQIKESEVRHAERRAYAAQNSADSDTAWNRFLGFFGASPKLEPEPGVTIRRGGTQSSCSGLASQCGGTMAATHF